MPARRRRKQGQATTETLIMMSFLLLMIFGLVHMSMLIATKYVVNYAAFAAARTMMVRGEGLALPYTAAATVLDTLRWWSIPLLVTVEERAGRDAVVVRQRVPFGLPIFNSIPFGGIPVVGYAPVVIQPEIEESGDNAEP